MFKVNLIPTLLIVALLSIAYSIYRSTAEKITVIENGRQTVFGEPQHGLILGLCIFAGLCVASAVALLLNKDTTIHTNTTVENQPYSKRIVS